MSFWENVVSELEYLGMTNKSLAEKIGITASNIGKGIKQGSSPSVETAVKIANVLNVSVEYLVTGSKNTKSCAKQNFDNEIMLYKKYHSLIAKCESLSKSNVELLEQIADRLEKDTSKK